MRGEWSAAAWRWCALVGSIVVLTAGCGVVFDAPNVSLLVRDNRIVFAAAEDREELVGGETVLRVANDSSHERQIVLARLDAGSSIPAEVLGAKTPREDDRILGMSHVMEAKEAQFATGGFGYTIDTASFHLYLAPGQRYVLFDRLGGLDDGVVLEITAGSDA